MIEGLRAEFPALGRVAGAVRRARVSREPVWWAFVSAVGAAFIATALVSLILGAWLFGVLFPPREPRPEWVNVGEFSALVSLVVAGAVALRAGGPGAVGLYVAYELLHFASGIPGRLLYCDRAGGQILPLGGSPDMCDQLATLISEWPRLVALLAGGALSRFVLVTAEDAGGNRMLRGAGAFSLVLFGYGTVVALTLLGARPEDAVASSLLVGLMYVVAGAVAGVLLARVTFARALLVAILVVAPSLAVNLPLLRGQLSFPTPTDMRIAQAVALLAPVLAAGAMLLARAYLRRRDALRA